MPSQPGTRKLTTDGDLAIMQSRLPPSSTTSATLHLSPPHAHAHFASSPAPPAYSTASSTVKSKTKSASKSKSTPTTNGSTSGNVPTLGEPVSQPQHKKVAGANSDVAKVEETVDKTADGTKVAKPKSIMSTRSRKSKWGNDDAEPLGEVNKRKWLEVGGD